MPRRRRNRAILARYDRAVQLDRPALVIVSGAPGSGKSTLARRLASDLRLSLLARDALKEALADAMGMPADVAESSRLGAGAYAVMYVAAAELLDAGAGIVVESNFRRGSAEDELVRLLGHGNRCLIHCTASNEVLTARYADRFSRGERHPAHLDDLRSDALADDLATGRFEPLDLPIPTLVVDTSNGYEPPYEQVRDFAAFPQAMARR